MAKAINNGNGNGNGNGKRNQNEKAATMETILQGKKLALSSERLVPLDKETTAELQGFLQSAENLYADCSGLVQKGINAAIAKADYSRLALCAETILNNQAGKRAYELFIATLHGLCGAYQNGKYDISQSLLIVRKMTPQNKPASVSFALKQGYYARDMHRINKATLETLQAIPEAKENMSLYLDNLQRIAKKRQAVQKAALQRHLDYCTAQEKADKSERAYWEAEIVRIKNQIADLSKQA